MSSWAQMTGSLLLNNYGRIYGTSFDEITSILTQIFGEISTWEDPIETVLPDGSEGSLQYEIIKNGSDSSIQNVLVVFHGSLRDYELSEVIDTFNWLNEHVTNEVLEDARLGIRLGTFSIQVNDNPVNSFTHDSDEDVWVERE